LAAHAPSLNTLRHYAAGIRKFHPYFGYVQSWDILQSGASDDGTADLSPGCPGFTGVITRKHGTLARRGQVEPATLGALGRTSRPAVASGGGASVELWGSRPFPSKTRVVPTH